MGWYTSFAEILPDNASSILSGEMVDLKLCFGAHVLTCICMDILRAT